ncbi:NADPH-dependent FMN reductase [Arachidicoccus terrestris]|uniref:NADPH-dependent FMN reductase n=1 Tax=Arachidicoccus terrestris TaxID=2875539 RepID=UPI001CC3EA4F|nr:NAD(P)H-dependent oxidoreductase [Arachidicoccus terrestris]UAY57221.1 NAD(P)H-dependent oxidoreductase [Arachidicoccus terrestris]
MNIEIVSGSARQESITLRAAKYLQAHLSEVASQHNFGLIDLKEHPLPFIDKVYFTPAHAPENIRPLAERMFAADAFILVTPEYNGTMAPSLVNWFGHFPKQLHKAFGLVTASNGALGGIRAAMDLQHFSLALFGVPSAQMLVIGEVDKKFDASGNLTAEVFQSNIDNFVAEFLWLAEKIHG